MRGWGNYEPVLKSLTWFSGVLCGVLLSILGVVLFARPSPELKCFAVQVDSQIAAAMMGEVVPISPPTQTIAQICFMEVEPQQQGEHPEY